MLMGVQLPQYKNQKSAFALRFCENAIENGIPVTAEVNVQPPNPGSVRFHNRHRFQQVRVLNTTRNLSPFCLPEIRCVLGLGYVVSGWC